MKILEGFIPRREMAKLLGRSERTLARWEKLKIGPPCTRYGNLILYGVDATKRDLEIKLEDKSNV